MVQSVGVTNVDRRSAPLPPESELKDGILSQKTPIHDSNGKIVQLRTSTDLRKEYVASRANPWGGYIDGIRSLPSSIDDITTALGVDLYERMAFDPQMLSLINIMKAATLSQPVDLSPAITDEADKDFKVSKEIHDHFHRVFAELNPTLPVVLDNMLDALYLGNKIAELVYVDGTGLDARRHVLRKIAVKHRSSAWFVVDRYANLLGFVASISADGQTPFVNSGIGLFDPEKQEIINPDKFAVLAFRPKDGDPRGSSIFRSAYNAWWLKMQIWPELLKYLAQFGGPGVIGFAAPDSATTPVLDDANNVIGQQTPEEVMLTQLEQWRNGSAAAFPWGALVSVVQASGNGEAFLNSIDMLNKEITKAITGQELATSEGQHQARASSEVHAAILELVIVFIKELVCEMLMRQVMRPSIIANWGEDKLHLTPKASLGKVKKQDKAALMTAYTAAGWESDPSQWTAIDAEMDVPPRDPASIAKAIAMKAEKHAADIAPPPSPVIAGSGQGRGGTATRKGTPAGGSVAGRKPVAAPAVRNRRAQ